MTRIRSLFIVIAATLGSAAAASTPGTATLAAPAIQATVVGQGGVWHCAGATCTGMSEAGLANAVAACSAVAGVNGRVAAFSAGATVFDEAALKRCNRHVR